MSITNTECIVLRTRKYSDSSKLVTVFGRETGKFTAIVKGVRNINSKQSGIYDYFNLISIVLNLKENRDLQIISKAELINGFDNIKSDLDRLNCGFKYMELINNSLSDYYVNSLIFEFVISELDKLNNLEFKRFNRIICFQLGFLKLSGLNLFSVNTVRNINETYSVSEALNMNNEDFDNIKQIFMNGMDFESNMGIYKCEKIIDTLDFFIKDELTNNKFSKSKNVFKIIDK
ncbi:MAG TPA: DNA repair protein RecO [Ignavibacteria bacterium]|nr:DNA repair protein RecO [Ignavibacteria bacterium]